MHDKESRKILLTNDYALIRYAQYWALRHFCVDPGLDGNFVRRGGSWLCEGCSKVTDKKIQAIYLLWGLNNTIDLD